MSESEIARYQRGGDLYAKLQQTYGTKDADAIAAAARTGDRYAITSAINVAKYDSQPLEEDYWDILADQSSDIFSAPLESANKAISATLGSAIKGVFSNPWVLLVVTLIVIGVLIRLFGLPKFNRE